MANRFPDFDLTTTCILCGHKIHPSELLRTGWSTVRCPKCGQEFEEPDPPKVHSTS